MNKIKGKILGIVFGIAICGVSLGVILLNADHESTSTPSESAVTTTTTATESSTTTTTVTFTTETTETNESTSTETTTTTASVTTTEEDSNEPTETVTTVIFEQTICQNETEAIEVITIGANEQPVTTTLTDYEYNLIMQLIANEYGGKSNVIERAKIVAATLNACSRNGWTIEQFVYNSCVPYGFTPGYGSYNGVSVASMQDAMDYYFTYGEKDFYTVGYWQEGADSWWGDGSFNHFYKA